MEGHAPTLDLSSVNIRAGAPIGPQEGKKKAAGRKQSWGKNGGCRERGGGYGEARNHQDGRREAMVIPGVLVGRRYRRTPPASSPTEEARDQLKPGSSQASDDWEAPLAAQKVTLGLNVEKEGITKIL